MKGPAAARCKLVIAHPDRKAQRALERFIGATACPVEVVADRDAVLAAVDANTIAVVDAMLAQALPEPRSRPARAWIAVPGAGLAPAEASTITGLLERGWDHVVAHPMPILAEELFATVQKLIRGDVFGLEKYLVWGADIRAYPIDDARDRDAIVAELARDVTKLGLPERMSSMVSVIADELIANAIYAAPVDDAGVHFRSRDPRDQARALTGRDAVTLRVGSDARYLGLEVRDRWGTFDVGPVTKRLAASGKQAGEGGMGLQLAYACSNQFVVACAPGLMTEVITLLDARYKPTELGRAASFHAFTGDAPSC